MKMVLENEIYPTICPLCGANCFLIERSDGNGGIHTNYAYDIRWLDNYEEAVFKVEQGSDVPNTSGSGS